MSERQLSESEITALVEFLGQVPLFQALRTEDLEALVPIANRETYAPGAELYHQSEGDGTLYIIYEGEVALSHIDPQGAPNEVGTRGSRARLGESALLLGEPHDVTVKALTPVTALLFTRNEFKAVCDAVPGLWGRLTPKEENARKINAPQFGWQADDESVVLFTREHVWSFTRAALLPAGVLIVGGLLVYAVAQVSPILATILGVLIGLILVGSLFYLVLDWRNDYYVVTNKRIVHIDEIPIIRKRREEAPLSAVTEIQFARNSIIAHLLDFGDLRAETFSGAIFIKDIPHPNAVKETIQREIERVKARARAAERTAIRDELSKRIIAKEARIDIVPTPAALPRPSSQFILAGIFRYFFPQLREIQGDSIVWRKHWVKLWEVAWLPFLLMGVSIWAVINWWNRWVPFGLLSDDVWWFWPIPFSIFFAWWLWQFEDWRNDIYILTSTRIIDIERVPFLLSEKRRETTLSRIQTTEFKIPTPLARFLRFGTLTIRVPGAVFEFIDIVDPAGAQTDINKRLAEFNKRQAENEARGRRNELSDWFAAYDQIRQPAGPPRAESPSPQVVGGDEHDNP